MLRKFIKSRRAKLFTFFLVNKIECMDKRKEKKKIYVPLKGKRNKKENFFQLAYITKIFLT